MAPGDKDIVICCLDEGSDSLLSALMDFPGLFSLHGVPLSCSSCPLLTASPELLLSASDV